MKATIEVRRRREAYVIANRMKIVKAILADGKMYNDKAKLIVIEAREVLNYSSKSCGRDIWIWIVNTYKFLYGATSLPGSNPAKSCRQDQGRP